MTSTPRLLDSPLAAAPADLDTPAIVDTNGTWTWRRIHEAAVELSRRLDEAAAVCNLCASRPAFLVTLLAALRTRKPLILPPSGGPDEIAAVLAAHAGTVIVGDRQAGACVWREDGSYLGCDPACQPATATNDELAWAPDWAGTSILLYTSGSTGTPVPQPKTLLHLAIGALVLGARLAQYVEGGVAAIGRIVCSVPPQHMFGFECSVMLPLLHGVPVLDRRPLLPADVHAAFCGSPPAMWVTTPLHLRSLAQSTASVPSCRAVIASTMPLAQPLARTCEQRLDAPVLEIYGSTETGALAMRRTAHEARWRPMDGVRLDPGRGETAAWGSHFASPARLLDDLAAAADGTFTLRGRQSDLVKIAGRRASLAGLNLLLQELPGLEDGVFYLPATDNPTERLCLIHSGPPLDATAARRWLRARIDPVFLPRAFIRLPRLPRSESGKLRRQALDLAFEQWQSSGQDPSPPVDPRPRAGDQLARS